MRAIVNNDFFDSQSELGAQKVKVLNLNNNSYQISHQRSCIRTLCWSVGTQYSGVDDKIAELQYLRRVAKVSGYPRNVGHPAEVPVVRIPNFNERIKNVSEAVDRLVAPRGVGVAHKPETTIRCLANETERPTAAARNVWGDYQIWFSCRQINYVGETGGLLQMRMAKHVATMRRNDASSQVEAHSTRPDHTFESDEAKILVRGDNRVSCKLLDSWCTGPSQLTSEMAFSL
nr:unnamed protein product [Spirometra erinaceieuropaei]